MSEASVVGRLTEALGVAVAQEAGAPVALVSLSLDMIAPGAVAHVETRIERRTRSLVFAAADAFSAGDQRLASATSVHKILSATA